ncbi:MAG: Ldh family oxidoreductase [Gammaproteobacteria bacterium]|nr:Ldh family oxidoreductase [Gammaproteobacteria bacterium]
MSTEFVMPLGLHKTIVQAAFRKRGYSEKESLQAAEFSELASWHGVKTHNALKALHLDHLFGSGVGGCVPGAEVEVLDTPFDAVQAWNAHKKLGQAVAYDAIDACMAMADKHGTGTVMVDEAFHYLWGGGYVIHAARKGYIAYTNCTAALAEVVPFMGKHPTLGTNPHSWGFPTQDLLGYPICVDWATSTVAMGRVQQFLREGLPLPAGAAVDKDGNETRNPADVEALLPFGAHKGYALALIDEIYGAYGGGGLPTLRNRPDEAPDGAKLTCNFFFQVIRPDALAVGFEGGLSQKENVQRVIDDVLGHGNENCLLPGQLEADNAKRSKTAGGLLFTRAELDVFEDVAREGGVPFDKDSLQPFTE